MPLFRHVQRQSRAPWTTTSEFLVVDRTRTCSPGQLAAHQLVWGNSIDSPYSIMWSLRDIVSGLLSSQTWYLPHTHRCLCPFAHQTGAAYFKMGSYDCPCHRSRQLFWAAVRDVPHRVKSSTQLSRATSTSKPHANGLYQKTISMKTFRYYLLVWRKGLERLYFLSSGAPNRRLCIFV